jgi:hypothetical protein
MENRRNLMFAFSILNVVSDRDFRTHFHDSLGLSSDFNSVLERLTRNDLVPTKTIHPHKELYSSSPRRSLSSSTKEDFES